MNTNEKNTIVCGVDVASAELVVRVSSETPVRRYTNDPKGIRELVSLLRDKKVSLVVCEHTGRHEWNLLQALWKKGIPVHCAHPKSVHNFAKVLKENAKSDPIDAGVLMEYGLRMDLCPTQPPKPEFTALRELTARRDDLNGMLVMEKNRLGAPAVSSSIKADIKNHIRQLKNALKTLDKRMRALVIEHESLRTPIERLDEEHGVGLVSAAALYANVPELGTLNRQSAAALVGLAPFIRSSGKFAGQRKITGGRTLPRNALYLVALSVIRKRGHPLRALYIRLKANGKENMVALTAVMRKLIIHFNTVLKELRALGKIEPIQA